MASQVSANVSFTGSITTLALYGTSNTATTAYVPQDFSSSGLNVSAFAVGNAASVSNVIQYSAFGPFAGEGSLYGGGGSGYGIKTPAAALDYNFGAMDYTFEAWIYITDLSSDSIIFNNAVVSLTISSPGKVRIAMISMVGSPYLSSTTSVATNGWYHVAATFTSATVRLFTNGVLTDTFTGVTGTPAYTSPQQMYIMSSTAFGSQFKGYLSNFRITRGLALYTTTFTPPTGPLQPIQGVTQAGLPYGTVLLLRNAPAPGRIQTTKFSGANSGQVLSFPPAAMTSYATALASGYGQGTYVASASSDQFTGSASYAAWTAFAKGASGALGWVTVSGTYNTSPPYGPTGSTATVDVNGNSYTGEWLQLQSPSSIVLANYQINTGGSAGTQRPSKWTLLGSRDGINWFLIDTQTNPTLVTNAYVTYPVSSGQAFSFFRYIVNQSSGSNIVNAGLLIFNGSIESVNVTADGRLGVGVTNPARALEVAGDVVCGGTLSAGNPLMFRNRIINGDFMVDQRGSATSVPTGGYGPDRWQLSSSSSGQSFKRYTLLSASDDVVMKRGFKFGAQINRGTGGLVDLLHWIELGNCSDMFSQPMTLSFWGRASVASDYVVYLGVSPTGTSSVTYSGGVSYYLTTNWQYITLIIPTPVVYSTSTDPTAYGMQITLRAGSGAPNSSVQYYTGVQLEKGTVATPFEFRPFATELARCQRYYYQWVSTSTFGVLGYATALNTTAALLQVPFPVQMRSNTPSANFTSSAVGSFATQGAAFGALSAIASTVDGNSLNMGTVLLTFATATAGQTVQVRANNSSTAFVAFNVEL